MMENSVVKQVKELRKQVEACIIDDEFKGYKASPFLKLIIGILDANIYEDEDSLVFLYENYLYVVYKYKRMGRFSLSAKYEEKALDIALTLYCGHNKKMKDVDTLLYDILVDRNYYKDDDCYDVLDKVRETHLIDPNTIETINNRVMMRRRSLNHGPVEMGEEYLAVIDEVEEKIDKNRTLWGMGSCHEVWNLKFQYLLEKGISWKSPSVLNPRVMFD